MVVAGPSNYVPRFWNSVVIAFGSTFLAVFLGTLAVVIANWPLFWVSVGLLVVAVIVGKVMAMAGLGKKPVEHAALTGS